jgi:hypothetical protein
MTINRSDLLLVSQGQNVTVGVGEVLDAAAAGSSGVTSVNGETGDVTLTASDLGAPTKGAAVASLTDNSGGTSGGNTIAAVTDVASAANAIATLAAKVDALLDSLRASGALAS